MPTTWILADARRRVTSCVACGRAIEFAVNARTGRAMPFDAPIVAITTKHDLNWTPLEEVDLATSHMATCPKVAEFRKRGGR